MKNDYLISIVLTACCVFVLSAGCSRTKEASRSSLNPTVKVTPAANVATELPPDDNEPPFSVVAVRYQNCERVLGLLKAKGIGALGVTGRGACGIYVFEKNKVQQAKSIVRQDRKKNPTHYMFPNPRKLWYSLKK
jgi:hypothetical protein